jgi:2-C-methyl-D-erythritol 2,4-cyclodiphosphate synthase
MALLRDVVGRVGAAGYAVVHVDTTVMMERPRLAPHRDAIAAALAAALGGATVNVKATTGERMGFVGRGEGVAALAVATLDTAG